MPVPSNGPERRFHLDFVAMMKRAGVSIVWRRGVPQMSERIDPGEARRGMLSLPAGRAANGRFVPTSTTEKTSG